MACLLEVTLQFRESAEGPESPWKLFGPNHAMGALIVNTTIRIQTLARTTHWQWSQPKAGSSVLTVLEEINTPPLHLQKYGVCVYLPPYAAPFQVNRSIWPVGAGFTCLPLSSKGCQESELWFLPCGGRIHHRRNSPIQEGWPKTFGSYKHDKQPLWSFHLSSPDLKIYLPPDPFISSFFQS